MADTIGYIQVKMKTATLQLARTHARFTHRARFARDKFINSLRSALRASLREEKSNSLYNLRSTGKLLLDHPKGKMLTTLGRVIGSKIILSSSSETLE